MVKTVLFIGLLAVGVLAQQPDLVIEGSARIKSIRFEKRPVVNVTFPGTPNRKTEWKSTRRKNLPSPVQPGRTYRDVEVGTRIQSTFVEPGPSPAPTRP